MAVELAIPVLQIVGYQNSGKTTLLTKAIKTLSQSGLRVGTIKHHGHGEGEAPLALDAEKDTAKYRQAGSTVTAVEGAGILQIQACNANGWTLDDMLSFYQQLPIDIILVEGFKKEHLPKLVLLRSVEDYELLEQVDNIKAIICWHKPLQTKIGIPTFHLNEESKYVTWIQAYFERSDYIE